MAQKKGLGRGLNDLLGTSEASKPSRSRNNQQNSSENTSKEVKTVTKEVVKEVVKEVEQKIKINLIEPNKSQPRKQFDEEALQELSDSIKKYGVLEPLIVTKKGDYYEIIAGERRWRAAKLAGLKEVPVVVRELSTQEIVEISLIENIQREDLNPVEEAMAYKRLIDEFNLKQDEVAERVSKSRTAVTNSMRLLKLDERVQQMVIDGMLTTGHARALLAIEDPEVQFQTAVRVYNEKMSVRDVEKLVKNQDRKAPEKKQEDPQQQAVFHDLEERMKLALGTKVSINRKDQKKGKIEIEYYSMEDLERLMDILMK